MTKLTSDFWVGAYLTRLRGENIPAFITAKGDATAGSVLVKINTLDGQARVFQRSFDLQSGERVWVELASGAEADVEQVLTRQKSFDPDVWVVEVEDKQGRHLLDQDGLSG